MPAGIQTNKLFFAARVALIATAMTFAFRAALEGIWENKFHLTREQLGWIFATDFYGFILAMIFGGPLCEVIGMKRSIYMTRKRQEQSRSQSFFNSIV